MGRDHKERLTGRSFDSLEETMPVYLLHFNEPYHHARHYLGSADDLDERIRQHQAGTGARLTQVIREHDIGFTLARTWEGGRNEERKLKRRHNSPKLCPLCMGNQK
jgi:predicted GIY-YIG superfamily endonuclease